MSFQLIHHPKSDDGMIDSCEQPTQQPFKLNPTAVSNIQELLECPICLNAMHPPIHQCSNGHTLCSGCKSHVRNRCPTCRGEVGNIRCLALEKIAASVAFPCRYLKFGCPGIYPHVCKVEHESRCAFRPYKCPYAGAECAVVGDIPHLISHLKEDHKVDMHSGSTFNHRCFGRYFCLHFEAFQLGASPVFVAFLRFMGDNEDAKNYSYSMEVGGNGRKLTWHGIPRSIRDSHRKVRDSHDGLIIPQNLALFFSGGDGNELKLRLTGRIWKEQA